MSSAPSPQFNAARHQAARIFMKEIGVSTIAATMAIFMIVPKASPSVYPLMISASFLMALQLAILPVTVAAGVLLMQRPNNPFLQNQTKNLYQYDSQENICRKLVKRTVGTLFAGQLATTALAVSALSTLRM